MRREWFHGRWIIQEIALARNSEDSTVAPNVCAGRLSPTLCHYSCRKHLNLSGCSNSPREYQFDPDYLGELDALGAKIIVDITNRMFRKQDNGNVIEHLVSLEALMSTLTMFEASSLHDTIYATLWLAYDGTPGAKREPAANMKRTP